MKYTSTHTRLTYFLPPGLKIRSPRTLSNVSCKTIAGNTIIKSGDGGPSVEEECLNRATNTKVYPRLYFIVGCKTIAENTIIKSWDGGPIVEEMCLKWATVNKMDHQRKTLKICHFCPIDSNISFRNDYSGIKS